MAVRWGALRGPLAPENRDAGATGRGIAQEGQAKAGEQKQAGWGGDSPLSCPSPPFKAKPAKRARSAITSGDRGGARGLLVQGSIAVTAVAIKRRASITGILLFLFTES